MSSKVIVVLALFSSCFRNSISAASGVRASTVCFFWRALFAGCLCPVTEAVVWEDMGSVEVEDTGATAGVIEGNEDVLKAVAGVDKVPPVVAEHTIVGAMLDDKDIIDAGGGVGIVVVDVMESSGLTAAVMAAEETVDELTT